MTHTRTLQKTALVFAALGLFFMGATGCSHSASPMTGSGTQSSTATPWTQGNTYTPISSTSASAGTAAATGTVCQSLSNNGSGGTTGNNCQNATPWDSSAAQQVLNGISGVNPMQPGVSSDLASGISALLQQAAQNGAQSVEQSCDSSQPATQNQSQGCFDRYALGAQVLSQCMSNMAQFQPQPGEPMIGEYNVTCPPISGYTDGKIKATVGGEYPRYNVRYNFPHSCNTTSQTNGDTMAFWKSAGAGYCDMKINDAPSASSAHLTIFNSAAQYKCDKEMTMVSSGNPIPAKVSQGMKQAQDCYRKALLLMSPLFDTMFNTMPSSQASTLLMSAMNLY